MKTLLSAKSPLGKVLYRVTALVLSKVSGQDIRVELERLEQLPQRRANAEIAGLLALLFATALLAASFGVWGLLCYFALILIIFR
ncbi:MAG: hypothetical protein AB8B58_09730 [Roseobacter sp.]